MTDQNSLLGTEEPALVTPSSEDKTMGILAHILCIVGGFLAPLIIYLVKKDSSPYVTAHAKESLNFQLTFLIAYIISWVLIFFVIGLILIPAVIIVDLIFIIIATIKASEGKFYKYPFSIKFVK